MKDVKRGFSLSEKTTEIIYHGIRFRNHLEARWAVFFENMNIEYSHKPDSSICYLPDFYLPQFNMYCEVKETSDNIQEDICKAINYALEKKTIMLFLSEIPYNPEHSGIYWFPTIYSIETPFNAVRAFNTARVLFRKCEDDITRLLMCPNNNDFSIMRRCYAHIPNETLYEDIQATSITPSIIHGVFNEKTINDYYKNDILRTERALLKARLANFSH